MNLNNIVYSNIKLSMYYKSLSEITEVHELIDEIYNSVDYLEPFTTGSVPSSCYCLLFKMWNMKLNGKQIRTFVDSKDSPYIRALGFLYLRYVCKPENIWAWFEDYLEDEESLNLTKGPNHKIITIGKLCRLLLEDMKFCGTLLPRIPVPIARQIEKSLGEKNNNEKKESKYKNRSRSPDNLRRHRSPDRRRRRSPSPHRHRRDSRSPDHRRSRNYDRRDRSRSRSPRSSHRYPDSKRDYYDRESRSASGNGNQDSKGYKETRSIRRYD
ncbi:PRP38-domain-containing protein [Neoconidiobolus thromboides FSU 785]|nr:PRP38-domain-containing protein [Neoconidiobolus thromboides FSU 785]